MTAYLRYTTLALAALAAIVLWLLHVRDVVEWYWPVAATVITAIGIRDLVQVKRSVLRNYPIIGHMRYFFEYIRPEIRQYFFESDTDSVPFSRQQRAIVYQRAKGDLDKRPFGTHLDPYASGYEWITHSINPATPATSDFRVEIGGPACTKPYSASIFNISAMSFGALSANAIRSLNKGAKAGGFAHDTGEGSISQYHREFGGDLIWEIGSGYFGCRNDRGGFDAARFVDNACDPQVRMIELKLSQGAKPGHGGVLPGPKVTPEIAAARGIPVWTDCVSPAKHSAFSTPVELLEFIARLRELSDGKPVGFKLAIGHAWEWFAIAKAMQTSGITPDFIVVDGKEGGTGAAPAEFLDRIGTPMFEGLLLVHNTLVGLNLRDRIRIGAAGKIITAFDVARTMAVGADWCNSARGFMFALGCIQAQSCHTGSCPTGVATQDPGRQRALVVADKSERVRMFHHNTVHALAELIASAGLTHPSQLRPHHIARRVAQNEVRHLANLYAFLKPGELLDGRAQPEVFRTFWPKAQAESFDPV